jgi:hypothetical protein
MKQELIIGPFVRNNRLELIGIDDTNLYLIKTNWLTYLKYSVNIQIPLFSQTIDKLLSKSISELKENYKIEQIDFADLNRINVIKSRIWRNHILIQYGENEVKFEILERGKTGEYEEIINKLNENLTTEKITLANMV